MCVPFCVLVGSGQWGGFFGNSGLFWVAQRRLWRSVLASHPLLDGAPTCSPPAPLPTCRTCWRSCLTTASTSPWRTTVRCPPAAPVPTAACRPLSAACCLPPAACRPCRAAAACCRRRSAARGMTDAGPGRATWPLQPPRPRFHAACLATCLTAAPMPPSNTSVRSVWPASAALRQVSSAWAAWQRCSRAKLRCRPRAGAASGSCWDCRSPSRRRLLRLPSTGASGPYTACRWPALRAGFHLLTTSKDRNGVEYVSSAEHKRYPFFATQARGACARGATGTLRARLGARSTWGRALPRDWPARNFENAFRKPTPHIPCAPPPPPRWLQWHPEKPPYEFGMTEIPHTLDAILVSQHLVRAAEWGIAAGWLSPCRAGRHAGSLHRAAGQVGVRWQAGRQAGRQRGGLTRRQLAGPCSPSAAQQSSQGTACAKHWVSQPSCQRAQRWSHPAAVPAPDSVLARLYAPCPQARLPGAAPFYQANVFVETARKSSHTPESPEQVGCCRAGPWHATPNSGTARLQRARSASSREIHKCALADGLDAVWPPATPLLPPTRPHQHLPRQQRNSPAPRAPAQRQPSRRRSWASVALL